MSEFTAVFNKHDLSDLFTISPPVRTLTAWEPTMVESVIGSVPTGTKPQPMEITLDLTTFAATPQARLEALRTLSSWLAVDEPRPLVLTDEVLGRVQVGGSGGTWKDVYALRDAFPTGAPNVTPALNASTARVKFVCPDPRAYLADANFFPTGSATEINDSKQTRLVWLSSSEQVTATFTGTAPTKPVFRFVGLYGGPNGYFRFSVGFVEGNSFVWHPISIAAASDASLTVKVDFEARTLTIGTTNVVDMSLEWFNVDPNKTCSFRVESGGFSSGSVSYYPRWW